MNEITLEDTLLCLQEDKYEIKLEENLRLRALKSIEKMFELG
jgi:quinolinate synthase